MCLLVQVRPNGTADDEFSTPLYKARHHLAGQSFCLLRPCYIRDRWQIYQAVGESTQAEVDLMKITQPRKVCLYKSLISSVLEQCLQSC